MCVVCFLCLIRDIAKVRGILFTLCDLTLLLANKETIVSCVLGVDKVGKKEEYIVAVQGKQETRLS